MSSSIFDLSGSFAFLIFEMAWKSTVILGGVILLNKFLKQQSASLRQAILSVTIVVILISSAAALLLPRLTVFTSPWPVDQNLTEIPAATNTASANPATATTFSGFGERTSFPINPNAYSNKLREPLLRSVFFIWLSGVVILLSRLSIGLIRLRSLRRASKSLSVETWQLFQNDFRQQSLNNRVTVLENSTIRTPVTWGFFRHIILLPQNFDCLTADSRKIIFRHELAHTERCDFVIRILAEIMCAILWFQPLAWSVLRQLKEEQERACDDQVLKSGEKASAYAKTLLSWYDQEDDGKFLVAVGMAARGGSSLKSRLDAILDRNLKRGSVTKSDIVCISLAVLSLAAPLTLIGFSQETKSEILSPQQVEDDSNENLLPGAFTQNQINQETPNSFAPKRVFPQSSTAASGNIKTGTIFKHQKTLRAGDHIAAAETNQNAGAINFTAEKKDQITSSETENHSQQQLGVIHSRSGKQVIEPQKISNPANAGVQITGANGSQIIRP